MKQVHVLLSLLLGWGLFLPVMPAVVSGQESVEQPEKNIDLLVERQPAESTANNRARLSVDGYTIDHRYRHIFQGSSGQVKLAFLQQLLGESSIRQVEVDRLIRPSGDTDQQSSDHEVNRRGISSSWNRSYSRDHQLDDWRMASAGNTLAIREGDDIDLIDLENAAKGGEVDCFNSFRDYSLSDDGSFLVLSCSSSVHVFRTDTGNEVFSETVRDDDRRVKLSRDGSVLAVATDDEVKLFQTDTGKRILQDSVFGWTEVPGLELSDDGSVLVMAEDDEFALYNLEKGRKVTDQSFMNDIDELAISSKGERVVIAHYDGVDVYEGGTGREVGDVSFINDVDHLSLSEDGSRLTIAAYDTLSLINTRTGDEVVEKSYLNSVDRLALSDRGNLLAVVRDDELDIYDASTGQRIREDSYRGKVSHLRLSSRGRYVLATHDRDVEVYSGGNGRHLYTQSFRNDVRKLKFPEQDERMFGVLARNTVRLFASRSGKELQSFDPVRNVRRFQLSANGRHVALGNRGEMAVFTNEDLQSSDQVKVAVLDSGTSRDQAQRSNPSRQKTRVRTVSFVDQDETMQASGTHGQMMTDVIKASALNRKLSPERLRIYDVQVLPSDGSAGRKQDVLAGMDWVMEQSHPSIDVANMSWTTRIPSGSSSLMDQAIRSLDREGILMVAAAGNQDREVDSGNARFVPAAPEEVLTVSGWRTEENGQKRIVSQSNHGAKVDVAANAKILSGSQLHRPSTSVAAARVTGIAASVVRDLQEKNQYVTPTAIRRRLMNSAREMSWDQKDHQEPALLSPDTERIQTKD